MHRAEVSGRHQYGVGSSIKWHRFPFVIGKRQFAGIRKGEFFTLSQWNSRPFHIMFVGNEHSSIKLPRPTYLRFDASLNARIPG